MTGVRGDIRIVACALLSALAAATPGLRAEVEDEAVAGTGEAVVLLHGLGRSYRSMMPLERRLRAAGYQVLNFAYDSREREAEALVADLRDQVAACCRTAERVHFVGHSLGAILIRSFLAEHRLQNLGRVVMLSPPNHGSEIVDSLGDSWWFPEVMGPVAERLGTGTDSLPRNLPPPDYEVGIIAGSASVNPVGSLIIPGDDDGMVSICNMRLEGMADFLVINKTHAFIMQSTEVTEQIMAFFRDGHFARDGDTDAAGVPDCPGDSEPPIVFEDTDACPFQCCTFGEWVAVRRTRLLEQPNEDPREVSSLAEGSKVIAETGVVRTKPGRMTVLQQRGDHAPGDRIYILTYLGEGVYRIWFNGEFGEERLTALANGTTGCVDEDCWATVDVVPESVWWVRIRTATGRTGWSKTPEDFSGRDACEH